MNVIATLRQLRLLVGPLGTMRIALGRMLGRERIVVAVDSLPHPLTLRFNNSDVPVFLGVFLHGDCTLNLPWQPSVIFDLGANTGITAIRLSQQFPSARVIAIEPNHENFSLCRSNTLPYPGITSRECGVSHCSGWGTLVDPDAISMSFQYKVISEPLAEGIRCESLAGLLAEAGDNERIFVKMDIEGAEIALFQNEQGWLPKVGAVLVEPHGIGTAELIKDALRRHDFTIHQVGEKILGVR